MLKKILSLTLAFAMIVSMFCGCSATQTSQTIETTTMAVKEVANLFCIT